MRVKNENHQFHRDSSARRHREDPPRAPERSDGRRALGRPAAHPGQPASPAETRHAAGRRRAARAATGPRSRIPLISRAFLSPAGSRKPRISSRAPQRREYAPNRWAKRADERQRKPADARKSREQRHFTVRRLSVRLRASTVRHLVRSVPTTGAQTGKPTGRWTKKPPA